MPFPTTLPPPDALAGLSRYLADFRILLAKGIGLWHRREPASRLPWPALQRANRLVARLQAILALLAAGRLPRTYKPRPGRLRVRPAQTSPPQPGAPPPPARLPNRVGWLAGRDVEVNTASYRLKHWLTDPATQTLLAEVPQTRRPVAALCRMFGVPPWPLDPHGPLPPRARRPRKPRPRKPRRETLAELRASMTHRCVERDAGLVRPDARPYWLPPFRKPRSRNAGPG